MSIDTLEKEIKTEAKKIEIDIKDAWTWLYDNIHKLDKEAIDEFQKLFGRQPTAGEHIATSSVSGGIAMNQDTLTSGTQTTGESTTSPELVSSSNGDAITGTAAETVVS